MAKKSKSKKSVKAEAPEGSTQSAAATGAVGSGGAPGIDFLGRRRIAFVISVILVFIGLIATASIPLGKANLGTDFSGGVAVQFRFDDPVKIENLRGLLEDGGYEDADIQEIAGGRKVLLKVKRAEDDLSAVTKGLGAVFSSAMPDNPFIIDSTTEIGPTVGKRLQRDALSAVAISLIGILIYIAWRFEFRFGVAAVIATFHDILAVLGLLFILDHEINLLVVTALLTIAGYSINDSVVVFDRIRENLRRQGKKKKEKDEGLTELINRSINEMLRRTIVTSGTTTLVLLSLFILGGEVIHDFTLTLIFGVIVGTYSSIFVASALLIVWKVKGGKLIKDEPKTPEGGGKRSPFGLTME